MRAQGRPGAAALRGCGGLLMVVLATAGLLAAAADHTALMGGLLDVGEVSAVLPGFTVNSMLADPSSVVGILPTLGFSEACLNEIVVAVVSCLAEVQFLPMLLSDPKVGQVILEYMPANSTSLNRTEISQNPSDAFQLLFQSQAAEAVSQLDNPEPFVIPNDQIQQIINELLPQYMKLSPEGKISER